MKNRFNRKLLSLTLVLMLIMASSIGVYADDENPQPAAETVQVEAGINNVELGAAPETPAVEAEPTIVPEEPVPEAGEPTPAADPEPTPTPEPTPLPTPEVTPGPMVTPEPSVTPTPEAEVTPTPTPTPEPTPMENPEEQEEQIEYKYRDNSDGTHTKYHIVTVAGEDEEVVDNAAEEHDFIAHRCICGAIEPEVEILEPQVPLSKGRSIEVTVGGYKIHVLIPLDFFMVEDVYSVDFNAKVIEVEDKDTAINKIKNLYTVDGVDKMLAFDFSFSYNGDVVQKNPNCTSDICIIIQDLDFEPDAVVHAVGEYDKINFIKGENTITFYASSFSPYYLLHFGTEEPSTDEPAEATVLYKDCAYGSAYTDEKHYTGTKKLADVTDKNSYAIQVANNNSGSYYEVIPATKDEESTKKDSYFIYPESTGDTFNFHFTAPENYYIYSVKLVEAKDYKNVKVVDGSTHKPSGSYVTSFDTSYTLKKMGEEDYVNQVVVNLQPIPVKWAGDERDTADGALFVNYKNNTDALGSDFIFNDGGKSGSNHCYFQYVYQDLAARTLSNGVFKLNTTGKAPFPSSDDYSSTDSAYDYISDYHSNVGVEFRKDTDGYWTLDTETSRYELSSDFKNLVPTSGKKEYRPFGDDNHFGMVLPLTFKINENGRTNDKPTVFKFSGDDDVFVYIDGKLVLDLGGIHHAVKGQIDFESGKILIQGDYQSKMTFSDDETCYEVKGLGNQNIYDTLGTSRSAFSQDSHKLTVVYFERGGSRSNCRISYNFVKESPVDIDFDGYKVDENKNPLEGAEFTLYSDAECTIPVKDGSGNSIKATSDFTGTFIFTGISMGIFTSSTKVIDKTYYFMETNPPVGYELPDKAIWQVDLKVKAGDIEEKTITALSDSAKAMSLQANGQRVTEDFPKVARIINTPADPGWLLIKKNLDSYYVNGRTAAFVFEVTYEKSGKTYSNVYAVDFDKPGTKDVVKLEFPAGTKVTVKEIYTGASYKSKDGNVEQVKKIESNKTVEALFNNTYDNKILIGSISITNIIKKIEEIGYEIVEKKIGGAE